MLLVLCSEFETNPPIVRSIDFDEEGGFQMHFEDGILFQVVPNVGVSGEHWRLFQPGVTEAHFVVG